MATALPEKIKGFRSKQINKLVDRALESFPLPSSTINVRNTPNGTMFDVRKAVLSTDERHFSCEIANKAKVIVHCGRWSNDSALLLCDKGETGTVTGTSQNFSNTFTVTGINDNGWILLQRTSTTITPIFSATFPTVSDIGVTKWPLARVIWNTAEGYIQGLEHLWFGGDIITGAGSSLQYHFRVEQASSTTVKIHGGKVLIEGFAILMTTDGGQSGSYADYKTLTISESGWVCVDLDSSTSPSITYITNHATYPDQSGDKSWPLAYVTFAAGAITAVEPVWTGGDIAWPLRNLRFDSTSGYMQISYCLVPGAGDWISKVEFGSCSSGTTKDIYYLDENGERQGPITVAIA